MKSEWRVRYNPNFPENPYNAYRLRDAYKVVEGGNVEPAQLNKEEAEK